MEYCRIKAGTPCVAPREGVTLPTLTPAETAGSGRHNQTGEKINLFGCNHPLHKF